MESNRRYHIFSEPRHNLSALVRDCGGEEAAAEMLERVVQEAHESGELAAREGGRFRQSFVVAGHWVTVDGRVVGGIARVSTAWIPAEES